jgi:hypothetical protein
MVGNLTGGIAGRYSNSIEPPGLNLILEIVIGYLCLYTYQINCVNIQMQPISPFFRHILLSNPSPGRDHPFTSHARVRRMRALMIQA